MVRLFFCLILLLFLLKGAERRFVPQDDHTVPVEPLLKVTYIDTPGAEQSC